jgi:hypothetical protein
MSNFNLKGGTSNLKLHEIFSVEEFDDEPGVYLVDADLTDAAGERSRTKYVSRLGDNYGLAPVIRSAVDAWKKGKKVVGRVPPAKVDPSSVRRQAASRIREIMPDHKQRNDLEARLAALEAAMNIHADRSGWVEIERIRAKSNEIEQRSEIPLDFSDDKHWKG